MHREQNCVFIIFALPFCILRTAKLDFVVQIPAFHLLCIICIFFAKGQCWKSANLIIYAKVRWNQNLIWKLRPSSRVCRLQTQTLFKHPKNISEFYDVINRLCLPYCRKYYVSIWYNKSMSHCKYYHYAWLVILLAFNIFVFF